jgi:hypothetical protein
VRAAGRGSRQAESRRRPHEPVDHRGQPGGDLAEAVQRPAAAELLCVVHDRLEAQAAFAFGVAIQRQQSEADLEDGQVPLRFLDHDCLSRR